ncbi:class I SAM-dependent methyltransferase [Pseudovibrio ascidiaceicola]|uniref:class I SAM-dependent methyltransferase n=1 Tax=Pseudovibrio ascidiaceicola TaxID=285279 RepID=UPI000D698C0F|nr:class I SAM-dependent methyltransferase [Pseudovibrio ascidiaceicola]
MQDIAGATFKASEVVDFYPHRPPYAHQIYECIIDRSSATHRLLDLGCGEGKIARPMTKVFDHVCAVDPSANMIKLGRSLENGSADNLEWMEAIAEEAPLTGKFDTVTFASSIHWMEPSRLFPKLAKHLSENHLLAIIKGDAAFQPPWQDEWQQFLKKWVPQISGEKLNSNKWRATQTKHLDYINICETNEYVSQPFRQTVEDFIWSQHSRDTFALVKLGSRRHEFYNELKALLQPHANQEGQLTFQVKTHLTIARMK